MFKRIATSTLIMGAVMSIVPALASAQDFDRGRDRDRYEFRERREHRESRERRERFRDERFREARGYYDRFGCWHRYY